MEQRPRQVGMIVRNPREIQVGESGQSMSAAEAWTSCDA
jgi:hypothetical protein